MRKALLRLILGSEQAKALQQIVCNEQGQAIDPIQRLNKKHEELQSKNVEIEQHLWELQDKINKISDHRWELQDKINIVKDKLEIIDSLISEVCGEKGSHTVQMLRQEISSLRIDLYGADMRVRVVGDVKNYIGILRDLDCRLVAIEKAINDEYEHREVCFENH